MEPEGGMASAPGLGLGFFGESTGSGTKAEQQPGCGHGPVTCSVLEPFQGARDCGWPGGRGSCPAGPLSSPGLLRHHAGAHCRCPGVICALPCSCNLQVTQLLGPRVAVAAAVACCHLKCGAK